jgi:hypothetical protein
MVNGDISWEEQFVKLADGGRAIVADGRRAIVVALQSPRDRGCRISFPRVVAIYEDLELTDIC